MSRSTIGRAIVAVALGALIVSCSTTSTTGTASPSSPTSPTSAATPAGSTPAGTTPGTSAAEASPVAVTTDAAFAAIPDPIPDVAHGTLLRYLEVPDLVPGATTYKIMYASRSLQGEPIVVTGLAVVPDAAAPPSGRPVLATAHGTTGVADECAPSAQPKKSEIASLGPIGVTNGWVVTETDYEGLGTPGRHPYLVGESEGRGVIDSALAASQLPDASTSDQVAIAGYSQGGHGALWANEVAPAWAPDLDVVGTFAGAPATEMDVILAAGRTLPIGGFLLSMVAGYQAAYPEADPSLYLTPEGVQLLDRVDQGCVSDVFKAAAALPPEQTVQDGAAQRDPWLKLAKANNPGQVKTDDPILIIHSDQDETVPPGLSAALHDRMCQHGQVVERRVLDNGGSHGKAAVPAYTQGVAWLKDRLTGGPAAISDCPDGPVGTTP